MGKKATGLEKVIDGLKDDVLWAMITYYALCRKCELPNLKTMSREDLVLELNVIESAQRDLVMRLTALDDKGDDKRSFRSAKKLKLLQSLSEREQRQVSDGVKKFTEAVNRLKTEHRNKYIGHVTVDASVSPRLVSDVPKIREVLNAAVRTLDLFSNKPIQYFLKAGSVEKKIDLREALGIDE